MPEHTHEEILPYRTEDLYALVCDVAQYPEFLPWCAAARILEEKENGCLAELVIRYQGFSKSYVSDVVCTPADEQGVARVSATMVRGPFRHLVNRWTFAPENEGTRVSFFIDFAFSSSLLSALMDGIFDRATHKMMDAFRTRAEGLYERVTKS